MEILRICLNQTSQIKNLHQVSPFQDTKVHDPKSSTDKCYFFKLCGFGSCLKSWSSAGFHLKQSFGFIYRGALQSKASQGKPLKNTKSPTLFHTTTEKFLQKYIAIVRDVQQW